MFIDLPEVIKTRSGVPGFRPITVWLLQREHSREIWRAPSPQPPGFLLALDLGTRIQDRRAAHVMASVQLKPASFTSKGMNQVLSSSKGTNPLPSSLWPKELPSHSPERADGQTPFPRHCPDSRSSHELGAVPRE